MISVLVIVFLMSTGSFVKPDLIEEPGPRVKATQGAVWPKPQQQTVKKDVMTVRPSVFLFVYDGAPCPIIEDALVRYKGIMLRAIPQTLRNCNRRSGCPARRRGSRGQMNSLRVHLKGICDSTLDTNMDETYDLIISTIQGESTLSSNSVWGILRGLETFSQLLYADSTDHILLINATSIHDYPRFSHRGILLDTSRHFIPLQKIMQLLDAMSYNKLNVFHWHIVDDQSFPYESYTFPELSQQGAYHASMVYSQQDIARVIDHAKTLGIRVMPEFDSPGHTRSWGVSHPELLTACYTNAGPDGTYGAIDPTLNTTYQFLERLVSEVVDVFPDKYLHLGGDEVGFNCWQSNPGLNERMHDMGIDDYHKLEEYYIQKLVDLVDKLNASALVWQEVFDNGVLLPNGTIVHIWTGDHRSKLQQVTDAGLPALLSTCWYLDHISGGGDWNKYYNCDPWDFPGSQTQKNLVLGGEACMWSEVVDQTNILQRIWPRASAVAEKLWSAVNADDIRSAARRLEEHSCRLNRRGIPAQPPNGPGFCLN